jgi:hypothetical protein
MRFVVGNFGHFSINFSAALKKHKKKSNDRAQDLQSTSGKQAPQAKPARNKTWQRKPKRPPCQRYRCGEVNLRISFRRKKQQKRLKQWWFGVIKRKVLFCAKTAAIQVSRCR